MINRASVSGMGKMSGLCRDFSAVFTQKEDKKRARMNQNSNTWPNLLTYSQGRLLVFCDSGAEGRRFESSQARF